MVKAWLRKQTVRAYSALGGQTRSYSAAKVGRHTRDWKAFLTSADEEVWRDLTALRARSRSLARDDDYFKSFLRKLVANVIGPKGFTTLVQTQIGLMAEGAEHGNTKIQRDRKLNKTVEDAFWKWSKKRHASASEKLSWLDLQKLCVETLAVDGEAFFRIIYGRNAFGFSLQQIDADWLDTNYNERLPNGNRIVMSVEMDAYDRVLYYHLTPPRHSYYGVVRDHGIAPEGKRVRVPASEMIHVFVSHRPGQTRGVPFAHTAMGRMRQLDKYEEAELINAIVGASKMGFVMPDVETIWEDGAQMAEGSEAPIVDTVVPGLIQKLPAGWKFESFDPKSPTAVFSQFCKHILRGIASGLGISYNTLADDLESVNYNSLRSGALSDRDIYRGYQEFIKEHFCEPVFESWLNVANGSPYLRIPERDMERVLDGALFVGRGWEWVDPKNEAEANIAEHFAGMRPLTEILAERGKTLEETLETYKYERELLASYGLSFTAVSDGNGTGNNAGDSKTSGADSKAKPDTGTDKGTGS